MKTDEKKRWDSVNEMLGERSHTFGNHWSYNYRNDPKRLAFVLSRYKFAAKMGGSGRNVLELGSGEGIGAPILAEKALHYTGVDLDFEAIETAGGQFPSEQFTFLYDDFMGKIFGAFDLIVSLDVVEHIYPEHEAVYFETLASNLAPGGIAIVGTPSSTAAPYASEASNLGHVNLFTAERLQSTLGEYFHNVFSFGMNDEVLHTGFAPMCHYLLSLACNRRSF